MPADLNGANEYQGAPLEAETVPPSTEERYSHALPCSGASSTHTLNVEDALKSSSSKPNYTSDGLPAFLPVEDTRDDPSTMSSRPAKSSSTSGAATTVDSGAGQNETAPAKPSAPTPALTVPENRVNGCNDSSLTNSEKAVVTDFYEPSAQDLVPSAEKRQTANGENDDQSSRLSFRTKMVSSLRSVMSWKKTSRRPTQDTFVSIQIRDETRPLVPDQFSPKSATTDFVPETARKVIGQVPDVLGDVAASDKKELSSSEKDLSATTKESVRLEERADTTSAVDLNIAPVVVKEDCKAILPRIPSDSSGDKPGNRPMVSNVALTASEETEYRNPSPQQSTARQHGNGEHLNLENSVAVTIDQLDCDELFGRILTRPCPSMAPHSRMFAKVWCVCAVVLSIVFVGVMILIHRMPTE